MGAEQFGFKWKGKTAKEAFHDAVRQYAHERGHGGYTGTIAEKHEFTMIELPAGADPGDYAALLMERQDDRVNNKWGPAGCFDLGGGVFYFFGWASS